ncbi:hypothetical protein UCRPC4_g05987 [Phaeomoniella chlamydospora]|uniref:Aromatic-ring-hydroxylating dioxygenase alpha subunit C-terminal domain-containing protein n=1 Tax=Phaeomoniella chlamydospora TaxID=158046 RepID=A0A0G2E0A3_PHACM|nr:hypothetical protein UCRPC4_g05987 [Phaeomoniella chlamydospora]
METGDAFEKYYQFVRQVALEDFELCERAQENLEKGIYCEGILNPVKESGVAYYQQRVLELVMEQHEVEKTQTAATRTSAPLEHENAHVHEQEFSPISLKEGREAEPTAA